MDSYYFVSWVSYDMDSELPVFGNSVVSSESKVFNFKTFEIYLDKYLNRNDNVFSATVLNYHRITKEEYEANQEDPFDSVEDYNDSTVINLKHYKR